MTATMNTALLGKVIDEQSAAAQQAEQDYWDLITDPTRTSASDQKRLKAVLELTGRTHVDAIKDQQAIDESYRLAADAAGFEEHQKAYDAARAAFSDWYHNERPKLIRAIEDKEHELRNAPGPHLNALNSSLMALSKLRQHRFTHPGTIIRHMPSDPPRSPEKIYVNGHHVPGPGEKANPHLQGA